MPINRESSCFLNLGRGDGPAKHPTKRKRRGRDTELQHECLQTS